MLVPASSASPFPCSLLLQPCLSRWIYAGEGDVGADSFDTEQGGGGSKARRQRCWSKVADLWRDGPSYPHDAPLVAVSAWLGPNPTSPSSADCNNELVKLRHGRAREEARKATSRGRCGAETLVVLGPGFEVHGGGSRRGDDERWWIRLRFSA